MDRDFFFNAGLQFEPSWRSMNLPPEQSFSDRFRQNSHFESALSTMVSSPVSNDTVAVRELIGKLGSIPNAAGEVSPVAPFSSSPFNSSPPTLNLPIMDHFVKENFPRMRNSMPVNPNLPLLTSDPGFAERAAKFSCFGSRSFNGRTNQLALNSNNPEFQFRSNVSPVTGNSKILRVSSTPSLKIDRSPVGLQENKNSDEFNSKFSRLTGSAANSNEESSVSEQIPSGEIGLKNNSRKRKTGSSKAKEVEANDDSTTKRLKKTEQENGGQTEENTKPPEAPKDYIHVRARRGQATDSHSLAERVRREKISERMKLLQDLVPNCNKVTGKALMLDEIINYVQSLQRQVEFLSMKLATVNPRLDFDMNTILSKDNNQQTYPIESSGSAFYQQTPQVLFNGFPEPLPQFPGFGQDDLQSIVQMGFGEKIDLDAPFLNAASSDMKMEL